MIIIKDVTMGTSCSFVATDQGYKDAYAMIQSIRNDGHMVGGDVGKVLSYIQCCGIA